MDASMHLGELRLRRLRAGELQGDELLQAKEHAETCAHCKAKLRTLDDEQHAFERDLSFERFAAGVTRASRRPAPAPQPAARWLYPALAAAAMVLLVLGAGPLLNAFDHRGAGRNGLKGGAQIDLRVSAGDGPQRSAATDAPEPLGPGERVRIGYEAGPHAYVAALSVDAEGVVTPLYPESGESLKAAATGRLEYLPDSVEFTGEGAEKVFVVLTDEPVTVDELKSAAQRAFDDAGRDVTKMDRLELPAPGEQFHRTLLKP